MYSSTHKSMVEVTQKGCQMLVDSIDNMEKSNMIMERSDIESKKINVKYKTPSLKSNWNIIRARIKSSMKHK